MKRPLPEISGLATASPPDGKIGSTLPVMENVDQSGPGPYTPAFIVEANVGF